jgi:hypothetical protein
MRRRRERRPPRRRRHAAAGEERRGRDGRPREAPRHTHGRVPPAEEAAERATHARARVTHGRASAAERARVPRPTLLSFFVFVPSARRCVARKRVCWGADRAGVLTRTARPRPSTPPGSQQPPVVRAKHACARQRVSAVLCGQGGCGVR